MIKPKACFSKVIPGSVRCQIEAPEGFVTYNWTTAENTYEGRVISVSPETNTVFNLEVTTPTGGVGGTSFIVYVYALPAIDAEDDLICHGQEKTITTLDGYYSYLWSTGSTTNTITVSPTETTTYGSSNRSKRKLYGRIYPEEAISKSSRGISVLRLLRSLRSFAMTHSVCHHFEIFSTQTA